MLGVLVPARPHVLPLARKKNPQPKQPQWIVERFDDKQRDFVPWRHVDSRIHAEMIAWRRLSLGYWCRVLNPRGEIVDL